MSVKDLFNDISSKNQICRWQEQMPEPDPKMKSEGKPKACSNLRQGSSSSLRGSASFARSSFGEDV